MSKLRWFLQSSVIPNAVRELGKSGVDISIQPMKFHNYFIYITTNPQRTVLYTGVTNDINLRMEQHRQDSMGIKRTYYPWVLPVHEYESPEQLMKTIIPAIIAPVEQKVLEIKMK